jgi:hypothetical protein
MAVIGGLPPVQPAGRRAGVASPRGGFDVATPPRASGDAAPAGAATEVLLGGLLALQEGEGDDVLDRRAKRRGQDILDALAGLRRSLLDGEADADRLRQIAALARDVPAAADARLREVVNDVVVRAHVELAKRGFAA